MPSHSFQRLLYFARYLIALHFKMFLSSSFHHCLYAFRIYAVNGIYFKSMHISIECTHLIWKLSTNKNRERERNNIALNNFQIHDMYVFTIYSKVLRLHTVSACDTCNKFASTDSPNHRQHSTSFVSETKQQQQKCVWFWYSCLFPFDITSHLKLMLISRISYVSQFYWTEKLIKIRK